MKNPLLSIVIATRNREQYCIESIKTILEINSSEIEVVVADNSESKEIELFLALTNDNRVVYKHNDETLSFVHNFNEAMNMASGDYVCLIGDDDTVLPCILELAQWAKNEGVDSITSNNTISYYWPGAHKLFVRGLLLVPMSPSICLEVNVEKELIKLLKRGIVNYLLYPLPKTYHGIVKRDILLEIKKQTGSFYGGLSPDIYSSIALSCLVKRHFLISTPFSIAGACPKSATIESMAGKHCGKLEDMPHLKNRGEYLWDDLVPSYYSVPTIWAESGLKALKDLSRYELYRSFNPYPLIAQGIIQNRSSILGLVIEETTRWRKRKNINAIRFWSNVVYQVGYLAWEKLSRKIKTPSDNTSFADVASIKAALEIIDNIGFIKTNKC